jgi:two-component system, LytTR family, response regulator
MKTIIVDDEPGCREFLKSLIEKNFPSIVIKGLAENINEAYELINSVQPDLVFLDIEMPGGNAFQLLEKFKQIDFKIIFTTAYDQFALRAIKFSAVDYLLKPIVESSSRKASFNVR